jgi:hypothetical protein
LAIALQNRSASLNLSLCCLIYHRSNIYDRTRFQKFKDQAGFPPFSGFASLGRTLGSLYQPLRFCVAGSKRVWISELLSTGFEEIFYFFSSAPFEALHPQRTERAVLRKKSDGSTVFFIWDHGPNQLEISNLSFHATSNGLKQRTRFPNNAFSCGFLLARPTLRMRLILSEATHLPAALLAEDSRLCPQSVC